MIVDLGRARCKRGRMGDGLVCSVRERHWRKKKAQSRASAAQERGQKKKRRRVARWIRRLVCRRPVAAEERRKWTLFPFLRQIQEKRKEDPFTIGASPSPGRRGIRERKAQEEPASRRARHRQRERAAFYNCLLAGAFPALLLLRKRGDRSLNWPCHPAWEKRKGSVAMLYSQALSMARKTEKGMGRRAPAIITRKKKKGSFWLGDRSRQEGDRPIS